MSATSRVMLPKRRPLTAHTSHECKSKRIGLNGHGLGVWTVLPARDPVYLYFTPYSGPLQTIGLTENVIIGEAVDELTPGNIIFASCPGVLLG